MYIPGFRMLVGVILLCSTSIAMAQGEAPEVKTIFIKVDPRGTYLFVDASPPPIYPPDAANGPTRFSLLPLYQDPEIQLKAGDLIGFELVGAFQFTYPYYGGYDGAQSLLGLFNSPAGYLYPGPMGSVSSVVSLPSYYRNISTDIPEDFNIPPGTTVFAQVPEFASEVLFSPNDAYFIDNSDPNNDYGVYLKISVLKKPKYKLKKVLYENNAPVDPDFHRMIPSQNACGRVASNFSERKMKFLCLEEVTQENGSTQLVSVGGCTLRIGFEDGIYDGGHSRGSHLDSSLRWGRVNNYTVGQYMTVPAEGLEVTYRAPEVSGEVRMVFDAKDPEGKGIPSVSSSLFQVRHSENLIELNIPGLRIDITSHPGEGDFVTPSVRENLATAIAEFREAVEEQFGASFVPELETEGASLSWGGLFDINKNWLPSHCTHRQGREVDISMSVFRHFEPEVREMMKEELERILLDNNFIMPVEGERPIDSKSKHWHIIATK